MSPKHFNIDFFILLFFTKDTWPRYYHIYVYMIIYDQVLSEEEKTKSKNMVANDIRIS